MSDNEKGGDDRRRSRFHSENGAHAGGGGGNNNNNNINNNDDNNDHNNNQQMITPTNDANSSGLTNQSANSSATNQNSNTSSSSSSSSSEPGDRELRFSISNESSAAYIKNDLLSKHSGTVVIRAPSRVGKSTLGRFLSWKYPKQFIYCDLTGCLVPGDRDATRRSIITKISKCCGKNQDSDLLDVLDPFREPIHTVYDRTRRSEFPWLILDEGHLLYNFIDFTQFFRTCHLLLLSSSNDASHAIPGSERHLSDFYAFKCKDISKYYWNVPAPDYETLHGQLSKFHNVYLTANAILFIWKLSYNNRDIFVRILKWIKHLQQLEMNRNDDVLKATSETPWSEAITATQVRKHFKSSYPDGFVPTIEAQCRAVKVNDSNFNFQEEAPRVFVDILCGGASTIEEQTSRSKIVSSGFLNIVTPPSFFSREEKLEFSSIPLDSYKTKFAVPNSWMIRCYRNQLKSLNLELNRENDVRKAIAKFPALACTNILCYALPYLDFGTVVTGPGVDDSTSSFVCSSHGLAPEIFYTTALIRVLKKIFTDRCSCEIHNVDVEDSPDVDMAYESDADPLHKNHAVIEVIAMSNRKMSDIKDHYERFKTQTNYSRACQKSLVIIGSDADLDVKNTVCQLFADKYNKSELIDGVEIIGISVSADHCKYTLFVKTAEFSDEVSSRSCNLSARDIVLDIDDVVLYADWVSRKLSFNSRNNFFDVESAQSYKSSKIMFYIPPPPAYVWVQQCEKNNSTDAAGLPELIDDPFKVSPQFNDVDDLKDAIKAKLEANKHVTVDAIGIKIYAPGAALNNSVCPHVGDVLDRNTRYDNCYFFELPE